MRVVMSGMAMPLQDLIVISRGEDFALSNHNFRDLKQVALLRRVKWSVMLLHSAGYPIATCRQNE